MDRLTYWNCKEKGSALPVGIGDDGDVVDLETICAKLAAYEDIGLEPEYLTELVKICRNNQTTDLQETLKEIKSLGNLDRLRELSEADRDGRCVVLPCKVGEHLQIQKSLYVVEGFLCNKIGAWKVHLVREIPEWIGNQQKHYYMSFRMFEKKRAEAEAALANNQQTNKQTVSKLASSKSVPSLTQGNSKLAGEEQK